MGLNSSTLQAHQETIIEDRRARVASFKCQGMSIRETIQALAKDGCVNPRTKKPWTVGIIQADVVALKERWRARSAADTDEMISREAARLDQLEREAWAAYRRSKGKHQVRTTKTRRGKAPEGDPIMPETETSLRTEELAGDPRFLETVRGCIADRRKLFGLDSPTRSELTGADGGPIQLQAVPADLTRLSDAELQQLEQLVEKVTPAEEA